MSFFEPKYWQQFAVVSLHNNTLALVSIPRPAGTPAIPSHIKWRGQVYLFGDTIKLEMDRYETAQIQGNKGRNTLRADKSLFDLKTYTHRPNSTVLSLCLKRESYCLYCIDRCTEFSSPNNVNGKI